MQKQKISQELTQKPLLSPDINDLATVQLSAENIAKKLIEKFGKDLKVIEKAIFSLDSEIKQLNITDVNFKEEVWWAV
jgi:hypothetical protein